MFSDTTISSFDTQSCIAGCNGAVQYNPQIQCGSPNWLMPLMAQEPDITRCVIEMNNLRQICIDRCNSFNIPCQSINSSVFYQLPTTSIIADSISHQLPLMPDFIPNISFL